MLRVKRLSSKFDSARISPEGQTVPPTRWRRRCTSLRRQTKPLPSESAFEAAFEVLACEAVLAGGGGNSWPRRRGLCRSRQI
jgi:hypothetical protein